MRNHLTKQQRLEFRKFARGEDLWLQTWARQAQQSECTTHQPGGVAQARLPAERAAS